MTSDVADVIDDLGVEVVAFEPIRHCGAAFFAAPRGPIGLSLGDRACLALAQRDGVPVVTADRAWAARLGIGVEVELMPCGLAVLLHARRSGGGAGLPFSPDATEACLAGGERSWPAREACVGSSAEACIDTPDGSTTVGMGFCLGAERRYWDARLNAPTRRC